ncbi:hypothetical protein C8F04DRAFT_1231580 [Mycena alexandri]|uniref:Uncharacterized protein n=1 Tax=Mycena alexandri TaxID=1745969 RepID=A0AAD6X941_9AGAR|nr:hypothetical protein C8F04DRAFT_1231580 [Mycena alexandri]
MLPSLVVIFTGLNLALFGISIPDALAPAPLRCWRTSVKNRVTLLIRQVWLDSLVSHKSGTVTFNYPSRYINETEAYAALAFGPPTPPIDWVFETRNPDISIFMSSFSAVPATTATPTTDLILASPTSPSSLPATRSNIFNSRWLTQVYVVYTVISNIFNNGWITQACVFNTVVSITIYLVLLIYPRLGTATPAPGLDLDDRVPIPQPVLVIPVPRAEGALPSFPTLTEGFVELPTAEVLEQGPSRVSLFDGVLDAGVFDIKFFLASASTTPSTSCPDALYFSPGCAQDPAALIPTLVVHTADEADADNEDGITPRLPRVQLGGRAKGRQDVGEQDVEAVVVKPEMQSPLMQLLLTASTSAEAFALMQKRVAEEAFGWQQEARQQRALSPFANPGPGLAVPHLAPSDSADAFPAQQKRVDEVLLPLWRETAKQQRELTGGAMAGTTSAALRALASSSANVAGPSRARLAVNDARPLVTMLQADSGAKEEEGRRWMGAIGKENAVYSGKGKGRAVAP